MEYLGQTETDKGENEEKANRKDHGALCKIDALVLRDCIGDFWIVASLHTSLLDFWRTEIEEHEEGNDDQDGDKLENLGDQVHNPESVTGGVVPLLHHHDNEQDRDDDGWDWFEPPLLV